MKKGFLLLELVIALLIISIACSITCRVFSHKGRLLVRYELQLLSAQCHYLHHLARLKGVPQTLTLHAGEYTDQYVGAHAYSFSNQRQELSSSVIFGLLPGASGPPSKPHRPITQAITFKRQSITFYPDGTSSSGTVYLTDEAKSTLYALSCGVAPYSYIRCYRYYNGKWQRL